MNPLKQVKPIRQALVISALFLGACNADKIWEPIEGWDQPACGDMGTKPGTDMAMPTKKALCKAAEGLPGGDDSTSTLVCVDFTTPGLTIDMLKQQGWSFNDETGCHWAIQGGRLVNMDLANLNADCSVKPPQKLLTAQQNRVTIAVVQSGTILNSHNLRVSLYLQSIGEDPLMFATAMRNDQLIVRTPRTDSRINNNLFVPIINHARGSGVGSPSGPGWQIESIAVIATP